MELNNSRLGLEQEFFIVDLEGFLSHRADEFLECCCHLAKQQNRFTDCFAPEFVKSIVEINTVPVNNFRELTAEYLNLLRILLKAAQDLDFTSISPVYLSPIYLSSIYYASNEE
jgi:carboxylate-amine ligase